MNAKDLEKLRYQVKAAWAKLPKEVQARLEPKIRAAHAHTLALRNKAITPAARPPARELLMLHSLLNDNPDALVHTPSSLAAAGLFSTQVYPDGEIYYGGVDYDSTDPGWAYCLPAMLDTEDETPPFQVGNVIRIPDNTTLAILGDWGGANQPALNIAAAAKAYPYIIHLGDVYYAGTNESHLLEPYESTDFVNIWPGVAGRSFALNSNHDMYAHATGYSLTALTAPAFQAQGGNCFALYNNAFRIVGLDTAYYAPDNSIGDFPGYMIGSLGDPQGAQMAFLQQQISQLTAGQKLILLTHHNGLPIGGVPTPTDDSYTLWQQVTPALQQIPANASKDVLWYWGHVHIGAVYASQTVNGITVNPRCCGHGCIPWGVASDLQAGVQAGNVLWFEQEVLGPGTNYFVANGYAVLGLSGASLTESFWNQNGKQSWPVPTV